MKKTILESAVPLLSLPVPRPGGRITPMDSTCTRPCIWRIVRGIVCPRMSRPVRHHSCHQAIMARFARWNAALFNELQILLHNLLQFLHLHTSAPY
ncbi:hypothetical protein AVEN_60134-1 [Araneus ventricosus]|uniref:Uncharacterized protein n=1 Tax=Araneus ventricosus TaxID=182803 RepID=A0A4Y2HY82_ARAVE|nr:hypothetical protein AVEN_60134-1 [Araneus ventricosus]